MGHIIIISNIMNVENL